jgi:hypothetical protein
MRVSEIERRAFIANPELRLIDIPEQAASNVGGKVSHAELAQAIKLAQQEYRASRNARRGEAPK